MVIKVGVVGALGKMGREVVNAVLEDIDCELVACVDVKEVGKDIGSIVRGKDVGVKICLDLASVLDNVKPDVVVDFTQPMNVFENAKIVLGRAISCVIGTTGLTNSQIEGLRELSSSNGCGCLIAPNFSTGAVLLMKFAEMASKYFDNGEIIELHHNQKKDAPSGTAIKTAQLMSNHKSNFESGNCEEKELIACARGAKYDSNIRIHSVRMPGYIASQEVLFGSSGQILSLRHDSMDRKCYMQGVLLSIKHVMAHKNFVYGLENIL